MFRFLIKITFYIEVLEVGLLLIYSLKFSKRKYFIKCVQNYSLYLIFFFLIETYLKSSNQHQDKFGVFNDAYIKFI